MVEDLKAKGAVFVEELDEVQRVRTQFLALTVFPRKLPMSQKVEICLSLMQLAPLVAKVHKEGQRYSADDFDIILIGHEGHPEVVGTMGRYLVRCISSPV